MKALFTFDDVIAGWHRRVRCEVRRGSGPCGRTARYHVTCHECGLGLVCRAHLRKFLKQVTGGSDAQCNRCGRQFASIHDAVTVVKL